MSIILYSLCAADRRRHYSPHVWKIIMALKHKELQAEVRPVSFAEIAGIEDGSYKSVPVLNDNGHIEGDSFEIAVHLERAYRTGPAVSAARAARPWPASSKASARRSSIRPSRPSPPWTCMR